MMPTALINLLGFFVIVLTLFMQWQIYVTRILVTFSVASLLIAGALLYAGATTGHVGTIILGVLTAAVRGITLPLVVARSLHTTPHRAREQRPVIPTATSILVSLALVLFSYAVYSLGIGRAIGASNGFFFLALLFQGGFLIVSKRNAFIQLAGYLTMENAVLLFGSIIIPGFPFIVEAGVILDLLGVVVVARIIMRLRESSDGGAVLSGRELRG